MVERYDKGELMNEGDREKETEERLKREFPTLKLSRAMRDPSSFDKQVLQDTPP